MKLLPEAEKVGSHNYRYVYPDGSKVTSMWPWYWFAYWKAGGRVTSHGEPAKFATAEEAARALAEQGEGPWSLPENIAAVWLPERHPTGGDYEYPDGAVIWEHGRGGWLAAEHRDGCMLGEEKPGDNKFTRFATPELAARALYERGIGPASSPRGDPLKMQIEEAVCAKIIARRDVGRQKYGVTMDENLDKLELAEWLVHHQEELMDAAIYVEAILRKLKKGS